jgi:hypothetical protein
MKVKELIEALSEAKNSNAEVTVIDKNGTADVGIFTVDEDQDGDCVHIVLEDFPTL